MNNFEVKEEEVIGREPPEGRAQGERLRGLERLICLLIHHKDLHSSSS